MNAQNNSIVACRSLQTAKPLGLHVPGAGRL